MELSIDIEHKVSVPAPIERVFEALLHRLGEGNMADSETPMPMKLERFPGGRWYRDLGDTKGHLWAHVQSYRPPELLEFCGPLMMSLPVANNVIVRLEAHGGETTLTLKHTAFGPVPDEWVSGMDDGWLDYIEAVRDDCVASS